MGSSLVCCVERQECTKKDVMAPHRQIDRKVQKSIGLDTSERDSITAKANTRYWDNFNKVDRHMLAAILDSWDSVEVNMCFFDVAHEERQDVAIMMPPGKCSWIGLSKVLKKLYSRRADVEGFSLPTVDPKVWHMIAAKYDVLHLASSRRNPSFMKYCVDNETASVLIRLLIKDLLERLSAESSVQHSLAETQEQDTSLKNDDLESASSQSTMASDQDVPNQNDWLSGNQEDEEASSVLSRLPSPSRQSSSSLTQMYKARCAKPKLPKLDLARTRANKM
eukprot:gnl/MRDRNA2_/MRDRNA2_123366_c0_seq1.p1 gnl/MRDRNA2_/MRDRNA2_123366_c0~~gnl/MRDRNA2_/MRDRNA2_123366_c0_seq1.p1  ORF type:complete len:279 (-),score=60.34 gnl/MRDRNA2_/MRDRNA2_123366_c0_seq1:193-1029(-)